jgi:hypothetical protein
MEDPGVDGRIILRWISRSGKEGIEFIALVQNRERWQSGGGHL